MHKPSWGSATALYDIGELQLEWQFAICQCTRSIKVMAEQPLLTLLPDHQRDIAAGKMLACNAACRGVAQNEDSGVANNR